MNSAVNKSNQHRSDDKKYPNQDEQQQPFILTNKGQNNKNTPNKQTGKSRSFKLLKNSQNNQLASTTNAKQYKQSNVNISYPTSSEQTSSENSNNNKFNHKLNNHQNSSDNNVSSQNNNINRQQQNSNNTALDFQNILGMTLKNSMKETQSNNISFKKRQQQFIQPNHQIDNQIQRKENNTSKVNKTSSFRHTQSQQTKNDLFPVWNEQKQNNQKINIAKPIKLQRSSTDINQYQTYLNENTDLQFGTGLQQMTDRNNYMNDHFDKKARNKYKDFNESSFHSTDNNNKQSKQSKQSKYKDKDMYDTSGQHFLPQQSTFSPQPSNISANKKRINQKINQLQKRQTVRRGLKRPSSANYSEEYLKTFQSDKENNKRHSQTNIASSSEIIKQPSNQMRNMHRAQKQIQRQRQRPRSSSRRSSYLQYKSPLSTGIIGTYNAFHNINHNRKQLQLSLANNLQAITFKYNGGHATTLYNYRLKVRNISPINILVKVLCTSPRHYDIRPMSEIALEPDGIMSFVIEMKLFTHDLHPCTMKHDLSRYKNDKFKIHYTLLQFHPDIQYVQGQKILPVVIEQTQQQRLRSQGMISNKKKQQQKQVIDQRQINVYKKLTNKNNSKITEIQEKIKKFEHNQYKVKYFTKNLFILVMIVGGCLGFWVG